MHYSNHVSMVSPKEIKEIKKYFPFALINHHLMHKGLEESNPLAAGGLRPLAKLESMGHQDSDDGGPALSPNPQFKDSMIPHVLDS